MKGKKEGASDDDLLIQVDELTEVTNALLQGSVIIWFVVSRYASHPKIWNWSELAYENGSSRAWLEGMAIRNLSLLSNSFFMNQPENPSLLGTQKPTLPDIVLFHVLRFILEFGNEMLRCDSNYDFNPLPMFPKIALHYQWMMQQEESKFVLQKQEGEKESILKEIFEEFPQNYEPLLAPMKDYLLSHLPPKK